MLRPPADLDVMRVELVEQHYDGTVVLDDWLTADPMETYSDVKEEGPRPRLTPTRSSPAAWR
jgi:hypothetical protein